MKIKFDFSKKDDSNDFIDKKRKYKKRTIFTVCTTLVLYIVMSILFKHVAGGELWPFLNKSKNMDDKKNSSNNTKEYKASYINVIIKNSGYASIFHSSVSLSCKKDMQIKYMIDSKRSVTKTIKANQKLVVGKGGFYDKYASKKLIISEKSKKNGIYINSIKRDAKNEYKGEIYIKKYNEGYLITNRLNLEDYLCGVVPSEMPASYGYEALKAQAVCARTYAFMQKKNQKYKKYNADVDDSTSFQVYNNQSIDNRTKKAVMDTKGEVLKYNNNLITAYYYSTSCGYTSSATEIFSGKNEHKTIDKYIFGKIQSLKDVRAINLTKENDFKKFINNSMKKDCFEKELPWYRWRVKISNSHMTSMINNNLGKAEAGCIKVYKAGKYITKDVGSVGNVKDISISKRLTGGLSSELTIKGSSNTIKVCAQYSIRAVLGPIYDSIEKADKKKVNFSLLPSGYFYINKKGSYYELIGGGFGHGAGLSQDGAMKLANLGKKYDYILNFYYKNTKLEQYS